MCPRTLSQALPLNCFEQERAVYFPAMNSVQFFRGAPKDAAKYLQLRLVDVMDANPWLAGRLVRDESEIQLHVPEAAVLQHRKIACFCEIAIPSLHPTMDRTQEMMPLLVRGLRIMFGRVGWRAWLASLSSTTHHACLFDRRRYWSNHAPSASIGMKIFFESP